MATVLAVTEIVTPKGLTIASRGESGEPIKGATPYDESHQGKVLVRFGSRRRAYWCDPAKLAFEAGTGPADYIAHTEAPAQPRRPQMPTTAVPGVYHFGKNLRLCRQARNLTQTELGRAMSRYGLRAAQATICYREGRPYSPNGKFVEAAARVLRVPAWVFFTDPSDCETLTGVRGFLVQMSSSVCEAANEHP